MPTGRARVHLGVARGVGATHAMLDEALRRSARGADVVVGVLGPAGAPLAASLERLDPDGILDPDAVIRRRPRIVLIDDLAELSIPGGSRQRWQDAEDILAAGIDVLATAEVESVASLQDVVESITGRAHRLTIPDRFLADVDQLELVDMAPEALRRRLAHGGIVPPEELDAGRSAQFRPQVLAALRELALTWMADMVGRRRARESDPVNGEIRERILVALAGGPESGHLLQRAARLTARMPRAQLHALHVLGRTRNELDERPEAGRLRRQAIDAGAVFHEVIGDDVASAVIDVARAEHATQVVIGVPRMAGWPARLGAVLPWGSTGVLGQIIRQAPDFDVHLVSTHPNLTRARRARVDRLPRWRTVLGLLLAALLPAALTPVLTWADAWVGLAGDALLFLLAVVIAALVGGLGPAVVSAVIGSTLLNYFFIPPLRTLVIGEPHNVITLAIYVLVAVLVGAVVHRAESATERAARAQTESHTLASLAVATLRGDDALSTLLEQVRSSFGMDSVALLRRPQTAAEEWQLVDSIGPNPPQDPTRADIQVPAGEGLVLALDGRGLAAGDQKVLRAFAAQVQGLMERDRLTRGAATAARLEATERLRDALLVAVGHDLRTPLASARAAITSLRSPELSLSEAEKAELLEAADTSTERLARVLADLLDLSRLRAGALRVAREPVWLDDLIAPALDELGSAADGVKVMVDPALPPALGDAALITRVLVNVLGNALRYSPEGRSPTVTLSADAGRVETRIIDTGPGIAAADREQVFTPFQRLGDSDERGLGLGLALSRGLIEAMEGTLRPEDTPAGGLTMVISLPAAEDAAGEVAPGHRERSDAEP